MTEEQSRELAGAVWCGEKTRNKVLDPELALEFARILKRECDREYQEGKESAYRSRSNY